MLDAGYSILKKAGVHGFKGLPAFGSAIGDQGSRFHFRSRTAFGTCIYKKNGKRSQVLHMCVLSRRPLKNGNLCSSSRKAKISTTGIY